MSDVLIQKKATQFRLQHGLSEQEPIRLKSLLLRLNVLTFYQSLSDNLSGMSLKVNDASRFILVNSNHTRGRQHFTLAHELYHLFVQENFIMYSCQTGAFDTKNRDEYNADVFASCLLMPENGLLAMVPDDELPTNKIKIPTLLKLEQYFSVSHTSLLHRMKDLGLLTKTRLEEMKALSIRATAREYGFGTALYEPGNEGLVIGDFGEKARRLFDDGRISEGHYMELMHQIGIDITAVDGEPEA